MTSTQPACLCLGDRGVCFRVAHPVVGPLLSLLRLSHNICLEYSQFNNTEKKGFDYCIKYL